MVKKMHNAMGESICTFSIAGLLLLLFSSCTTFSEKMPDENISDGYIAPTTVQKLIVESGLSLINKRVLKINDRNFSPDCTGTILAAYWGAGLDPGKYFNLYQGNGVKRLYDMGEHYSLGYIHQLPAPGDVVIWDNTYDKDKNGKWGDLYTHAGIVVDLSDTGQISYLHYNYAQGVVVEKMNLIHPNTHTDEKGELLNSPMRMRSDRHIKPESWLAGQLFRNFVPLYEYPNL